MSGLSNFSSDIFKLSFIAGMDVQYIADYETGQILMANPQFSTVLGYTQQEIAKGSLFSRDMIETDELDVYEQRLTTRKFDTPENYTIRVVCKNGDIKTMEFSVIVAEFEDRHISIGNARDVTSQMALQQKLQKENKRYRELTYDTARANVRIYQLTEKIRRVPQLLSDLISTSTEEELFQKAAEALTDPQGLKYEQVIFMLLEDDVLKIKYVSQEVDTSHFSMGPGSLFYRIAAGEQVPVPDTEEYYLEPISGFDDLKGVVVMYFDPQEKILFDENNRIKSSQRDLVRTLAQFLGMQLQNIRLFDKVRMQSITDQATGLYNRRYFETKIQDEVQRALRYNRDLSLLHVDLDGFKEVNDTAGHLQGDLVLQQVASLLRTVSRESDVVCRCGGDEFMIILPETSTRDALIVSQKLLDASHSLEYTRIDEDTPVPPVSFSIGVASTSTEIESAEQLYSAADIAMYESKFAGKDQITVAKPNRAKLEADNKAADKEKKKKKGKSPSPQKQKKPKK